MTSPSGLIFAGPGEPDISKLDLWVAISLPLKRESVDEVAF
jgi:hypothetical protein